MTAEELKDTYNNRTISINGESLGKVVGIELDYDTVCFTFEDLTKKYITLNNLSQITIAFEKSIPEDMQYFNFIKDFNSNGINKIHKIETTDKLNGSQERKRVFQVEEKLYYSNTINHAKNFSKIFNIENGDMAHWIRISGSEVNVTYLSRFTGYHHGTIKLPKL